MDTSSWLTSGRLVCGAMVGVAIACCLWCSGVCCHSVISYNGYGPTGLRFYISLCGVYSGGA